VFIILQGDHAGNLLRHFYTVHRAVHDEIVRKNNEDKENRDPNSNSDKASAVMELCTDLVTKHGRPFTLVEDEAFKNILKMIPGLSQTDIAAINVKNVKENIRKKASDIRLEISQQLDANLVCVKVDVASVKLRRFLGVNVQYISGQSFSIYSFLHF
jgi:hypothetical protein